MSSLKEQILEAAKANRGKTQPITAWGVPGFIRIMSGTERDAWEAEIFKNGKMDKDRFRARLLVKVIATENGDRVFSQDDIPALSDMDSVELDRLYTIAARANGLSKEDEDALTKNSPGDRVGSSTSGSPGL